LGDPQIPLFNEIKVFPGVQGLAGYVRLRVERASRNGQQSRAISSALGAGSSPRALDGVETRIVADFMKSVFKEKKHGIESKDDQQCRRQQTGEWALAGVIA
jgi:hypothetical protein